MESIDALKWRYATKYFDSKKELPEEKINKLKKAFNLTATSYGLQPLKLVVVHNKTVQEELYQFSYKQQQIATASHVLVLCIERKIDKLFIENYFKHVRNIRQTPENVLSPFKEFLVNDFGKKPLEEIRIWATHQAYLVLGTLLTVCAVEGIDSCPMEGFEPEKYNEALGLADRNLEAVLVLPVGIRDSDDSFSRLKKVRRPLEDIIIDLD